MDRWLVVTLTVLVVLAGCAGGAPTGGADLAEATVTDESAYTVSDGSAEVESGRTKPRTFEVDAKRQARYRIKTAHVVLEVEDYGVARDRLVAKTQSLSGYVDGETRDHHTVENRSWTTGTLVLRVPAERYQSLIATVEASGTVRHTETDTVDVTGKVVDLRARLRNLRAQRDRLRALYERANDTEAILQVGRGLSEVQGDIERAEGRLRVLENRIAYSTVRVELREARPELEDLPGPERWYEIGIVAAFVESIHGVLLLGRMVVVGVAYLAPYALAFGVPAAGLYVVLRRVS